MLGFGGAMITNKSDASNLINSYAIAPRLIFIAVVHSTTPYVSTYPWSGSGFGTKFSDPATLPAGTVWGVAFSPSGTEIAVAHNTTPFVSTYPWSASGFGTKFSNPATLPASTGWGVAFGLA